MGGASFRYPEQNCCDCGKSSHVGLPSTVGLQCLVYTITDTQQHRLSAVRAASRCFKAVLGQKLNL